MSSVDHQVRVVAGSATGKYCGHLHSLNRHGPGSVWMNSECRHHEQEEAKLASRLTQRTADRSTVVMEPTVGCACYRVIGCSGSVHLHRKTYSSGSLVADAN